MIELIVQDYCQNCDAFDPCLDDIRLANTNGERLIYVKCRNARHCMALVRYLKRAIKEEVNDD